MSDGALGLIAGGRLLRSDDGGATWGEPLALELPDAGRLQGLACIRLQAGSLALVYRDRQECFRLVVSKDDGRTWRQRSFVDLLGSPYYDALIETGDGTLVLPSRECYGNDDHPGLEYRKVSTWGTWKGLPLQVSGHYHYPEIDIAAVSRSGDEGRTWQRGGPLMGWFDEHGIANGYGGISACDEPSVAETADGRLLFFARSTVGRIVASSSSDGGERWTAVRPTELAASYSPPRLRRIPATGDLICVWNQVSREEIRRGHRRGRLSAAISRDSGRVLGALQDHRGERRPGGRGADRPGIPDHPRDRAAGRRRAARRLRHLRLCQRVLCRRPGVPDLPPVVGRQQAPRRGRRGPWANAAGARPASRVRG